MPRLRDTAVSSDLEPARWAEHRGEHGAWLGAEFTGAELERLLARLAAAGPALRRLVTQDLLAVWDDALASLVSSSSQEHRRLLAFSTRLSPAGLDAALRTVLGGLRRPSVDRLASSLESERGAGAPRAVFLAANLPALAAQPLLRALLERRPVLLKSASAEPFFAPVLVSALTARLPELAPALAALTWRGGDRAVEHAVLAHGFDVELYGGADAVASLAGRASSLLVHGPMASLAVIGPDADLGTTAAGLAEDIALFDQRGCLSVQAVYVVGSTERAHALAGEIAVALRVLEQRWPPGPATPEELAGAQQLRAEAELRELVAHLLQITAGTVIVEPRPAFVPSPGLRSVRVHPLAEETALSDRLRPWAGHLQGVATAGVLAQQTLDTLVELGVSRISPAGELQHADATWANWGERLS